MPPNASKLELPSGAVKLSSPGVPCGGACGIGFATTILTSSVSVNVPPVPVLPLSLVVTVSVSLPTKSCVGA